MIDRMLKLINKYTLHIAFLHALAAMMGSLYFSEILLYRPCLLCWYQRILMYPLVIILAVALWRRDKNVAYYVLPLSIIGAVIALYHYLLQMTPLANVTPIECTLYGPCSEIQAMFFGFVTIPFLSFTAFTLITIMMILTLRQIKSPKTKR